MTSEELSLSICARTHTQMCTYTTNIYNKLYPKKIVEYYSVNFLMFEIKKINFYV